MQALKRDGLGLVASFPLLQWFESAVAVVWGAKGLWCGCQTVMSDVGLILWYELLSWFLLVHQLTPDRMKQSFSRRVSNPFDPALGLEPLLVLVRAELDMNECWNNIVLTSEDQEIVEPLTCVYPIGSFREKDPGGVHK